MREILRYHSEHRGEAGDPMPAWHEVLHGGLRHYLPERGAATLTSRPYSPSSFTVDTTNNGREPAADAYFETAPQTVAAWRRWLPALLIIGSPFFALAMTLATYWFIKFFGIELGAYIGDLFALAGSAVAFVGCAIGGILIRRSLPVRIIAVVVAGVLGPVAFLAALLAMDLAVGWF